MTDCLKVQNHLLFLGIFPDVMPESSLNDLKQTVKKKLGLSSDSSIGLAQIRDGQAVDLEDGRLAHCALTHLWILNTSCLRLDDDFEAFCTVAYSQRSVNVEVRLVEIQTSQDIKGEVCNLLCTYDAIFHTTIHHRLDQRRSVGEIMTSWMMRLAYVLQVLRKRAKNGKWHLPHLPPKAQSPEVC